MSKNNTFTNAEEKMLNKLMKEEDQRRAINSLFIFNKPEHELEYAEMIKLDQYMHDSLNPQWKQVIYDGKSTEYFISNTGILKKGDKIITQSESDQGYMRSVIIKSNGQHKTVRIHRLVAKAFIPNPGNKPEVNHINCNKKFNWVGNLEWVTSEENKQHAIENGLYNNASFLGVGQDRPNTKYTDEQVREVCKLLEAGKQPKEISELLGVPRGLPNSIKYDGKWAHISKDYKIPVKGEISRAGRHVHSKLYTDDQIHQVCKLLEQGKSNIEISKELGIDYDVASSIKGGHAYQFIAKNYNIPKPSIEARPKEIRDTAIKIIKDGEMNSNIILNAVGLPITRTNQKWIASLRYRLYKSQRSTTIENSDVQESMAS